MSPNTEFHHLVYNRLPFLSRDTDEAVVVDVVGETLYLLQRWLKKEGQEVEDPAAYNPLERGVVADVAAVQIALRKAMLQSAGESGEAPEGTRFVKRAKAGSAEVEFESPPGHAGGMAVNLRDYVRSLLATANSRANTLGFSIREKGGGVHIVGPPANPPGIVVSNPK